MVKPKIAIIGRGLGGLTLAFRMVEAGYQPTVFGMAKGPSNASRCAQGVVCNKGLIFADSPLFRAKLRTIKQLEPWLARVEKAAGQPIPRLWQGVDEPYWTDADFQKTVQRVYRGNFWGCYRPQNRPATDWAADLQRPLGFLHYPDDAWFDVDAAMNALETAAMRQGAQFVDGPVNDLADTLAQFDHTVVAAGAETLQLIKGLGLWLPRFFLVAGQSVFWDHAPRASAQVLVKGTLSLTVLKTRHILGSSSFKPEDSQASSLVADRQELLKQAQISFGLSLPPDREVQFNWGTRLRFADRMPALGVWPESTLQGKLSILTGFYKNGLQLADTCAEQLLRELQGESLDEFGRAFHITRLLPIPTRDNLVAGKEAILPKIRNRH